MLGMNSVLQGVTVLLSSLFIYLKINHCAVYYLLPYILECKMKFFPKIWHLNIEVIFNSCMKHWIGPCHTGSLWTGPCIVKPRPAAPNCHV